MSKTLKFFESLLAQREHELAALKAKQLWIWEIVKIATFGSFNEAREIRSKIGLYEKRVIPDCQAAIGGIQIGNLGPALKLIHTIEVSLAVRNFADFGFTMPPDTGMRPEIRKIKKKLLEVRGSAWKRAL